MYHQHVKLKANIGLLTHDLVTRSEPLMTYLFLPVANSQVQCTPTMICFEIVDA